MEKKEKILIVHNYYQVPGGEDTVVANEKRMLEAHGYQVVLYTRNNGELKEMSGCGKLFLLFIAIFNLRTYKDLKTIIKNQKIDIVHVHNTLTLISPSVYYAALSMKVPVVQTVHNFRFLCPGATFYRDGHVCEDCVKYGLGCAIKHRCYRGSRLQTLACVLVTKIHRKTGIYGKINYICLTEFNKKKLLQLKQIKAERVFIKPNFVESIGGFIPVHDRENQFVFAGRLDRLKGVDLLLKAWKKMGEEAPRLIICGTGPMEEWCRKYIRENRLNVEMLGFVQNVEVRKLVAKCRALILPTQWYEGFPMSMIEAFSVGTPVICSDWGNCGSIVEDGVNGYKFVHNSVNGIVKAITGLSSRSVYYSTYKRYEELYSSEKNFQMLKKIYQQVG